MTVTKRTRFEVLKRDNYTCRYCRSEENALTVDHVVPVALGGSDDSSNLVAACKDCNYGKASSSPEDSLVADVADDALRWAAAISAYNAGLQADRKKRDAYVRRFKKAWDVWHWGVEGDTIPLPSDWKSTIWSFYASGLPATELEDAVTIAAGNQMVKVDSVFRYLCGVVKNKIERQNEGARAFIDAGDA